MTGQPYDAQWYMQYFDVQIYEGDPYKPNIAMFKRNIFTRTLYIFQFNCCETGNSWNERGYGWGVWKKL